jgi:hypothetical protein
MYCVHLKAEETLNYQKALGVRSTTVKPVGKKVVLIPVYRRKPAAAQVPVGTAQEAVKEVEPLQVEVTSFSTNTMRTN